MFVNIKLFLYDEDIDRFAMHKTFSIFEYLHTRFIVYIEHKGTSSSQRLKVSRARESRPVDTIRLIIQTCASFNAFRETFKECSNIGVERGVYCKSWIPRIVSSTT